MVLIFINRFDRGESAMLQDLFLLQHYYEEPAAAMYEEDLVARYGAAPVQAALAQGLLEQRRVPCRGGAVRCICWLSQYGRACAVAGRVH